jgi:hypothetical protein
MYTSQGNLPAPTIQKLIIPTRFEGGENIMQTDSSVQKLTKKKLMKVENHTEEIK